MFESDAAAAHQASALAMLAPGAELAAWVAGTDPAELSAHDLVDYLAATHRLSSWVSALQLGAVAELAGRRPGSRPFDPPGAGDRLPAGAVNEFVDVEIAAELRLSRAAAHARLDVAVRLQRLPQVLAALAGGLIDLPKARVLADAVCSLDAAGRRDGRDLGVAARGFGGRAVRRADRPGG